jgi:hypothetical protein
VASSTIRRGKEYKAYVRGLDIKADTKVTLLLTSNDGRWRIEKSVTLDVDEWLATLDFDVSLKSAEEMLWLKTNYF